jgi:dinuclear metal center YbgI/SA1388 family protein
MTAARPAPPTVGDVAGFLDAAAPPDTAAEWDNVGLLVGDRTAPVGSLLTCLTLTADVAEEAVACGANLIVTHHPVLFRPVQRIVADTRDGAVLLKLIGAGIAVHSPHTAYDDARDGVNAQLAEALGLRDVRPLRPAFPASPGSGPAAGAGRCGTLDVPVSLSVLCERVKAAWRTGPLQVVGDPDRSVSRVGLACGSAAEFLTDAHRAGCDAFLTGEARFHAGLEARDLGVALVLAGHYATERPAVEVLASRLAQRFPGLVAHASRVERDPLRWC